MAVNDGDRVSTAKLLETLKGLQASRHLGSEPELDPQTGEKTKHTIKQDYVPNADWSVNDPDADGYVEGRTHWVEFVETEATVNVQSVGDTGNMGSASCDKFGAVKGFTYPNGEYNPGRTGAILSSGESEILTQASYVGEDSNGQPIILNSLDELQSALMSTKVGVLLYKMTYAGNESIFCYIAYPDAAISDVCEVKLETKVVHKLDRKFYDYTPPTDLNGYLETRNAYQVTSGSDYCYFLNENVITNIDDNKKSINGYTFEPVDAKMDLYVDRSDNPFFYLRKGFGRDIWYLYPITHSNTAIKRYIPYIGIGKKIIITPSLGDSKNGAPDPSQYYDMFIPNVGYYWNYRNGNGSTNVTEFLYENNDVSIVDENNHLVGNIFGVNMPSEVRNYYTSYSGVDNIGSLNRPLRLGAVSNSEYVDYTSKNPYLSSNKNTTYTGSLNGVTLHGAITIEEAPTSSPALCDKKRIKSFEYDITNDINLSSDTFTTIENVFGVDLTTFDVVLPDGRYGKFSKTTMTLNDNTTVNRLPAGSLIYKHGRFDIG